MAMHTKTGLGLSLAALATAGLLTLGGCSNAEWQNRQASQEMAERAKPVGRGLYTRFAYLSARAEGMQGPGRPAP